MQHNSIQIIQSAKKFQLLFKSLTKIVWYSLKKNWINYIVNITIIRITFYITIVM